LSPRTSLAGFSANARAAPFRCWAFALRQLDIAAALGLYSILFIEAAIA
jgi:hypothetical protein